MTQGFYTSISGMNTAQDKINVIADNIANMNTVAFKQSNVTFQNVFSRTISNGSSPLDNIGGTNPMQVGFGTKLASITRNFSDGTFQSTGIDTNLYFEGNGFFTVLDENNQVMLSRAGDFTRDAEGCLVTQEGFRVLGMSSPFSKNSSTTPIKIPPTLNMFTTGNENIAGMDINSLNNFNYKEGKVAISVNCGDNGVKNVEVDISGASSLNDIANKINTALEGALGDKGVQMVFGTGENAGTIQMVVDTTAASTPVSIDSMGSVEGGEGSDFFSEIGLSTQMGEGDANVTYTSNILDYNATVGPGTETDSPSTFVSMSVNGDGSIVAKYSNGDSLTVQNDGTTISLLYKTAEGVDIAANKIQVNENVIEAGNLQLQLATVINEQGLTSVGGNLYEVGLNAGELSFSCGGSNGLGTVGNAGLESSNVDLSTQFAEMIIAQRSIEANSRTFDTVNQVLQRIVQLGR